MKCASGSVETEIPDNVSLTPIPKNIYISQCMHCKKKYTVEEWFALPYKGKSDFTFSVLDYRDCPCGAHGTMCTEVYVHLDEVLLLDKIASASRFYELNPSSVDEMFNAAKGWR